jgi:hypothetical protein
MYKAKAYSAASATSPLDGTTIPWRDPTAHDVQTPISIKSVMSGRTSCLRSTLAFQAMRSLAGSPGSARQSRSSSRATSLRSAAWSIQIAFAPSDRSAWSSSARTGPSHTTRRTSILEASPTVVIPIA